MPTVRSMLEVLGLWLVTVAVAFPLNAFTHNEVDTLASARQWARPEWLPGDWYLNLDIGYRVPFNLVAGPVAAEFGFVTTALLFRGLGAALFAVATWWVGRALGARYGWVVLAVGLFVLRQDVAAGEWMVGGAESKAFAWPLALLAVGALLRRRVALAALAAGLSVSFHVLVGLSLLGALLVGAAATRRSWGWERTDLLRAWPLLPAGAWGWRELALQLAPGGGVGGGSAGWAAYVEFRVSHHLLPSDWHRTDWVAVLAATVLVAVAVSRWGTTREHRLLAATAAASGLLFGFGLLLWVLGQTELLRFYWFRFPDSFLLWASLLLLAALASRLPRVQVLSPVLALALPGVAVVDSVQELATSSSRWYAGYPAADTLQWLAANTPRDAVLLVDPSIQQVYLHAERAAFVTYKHSPQSGADVAEWARRLELASGVPVRAGTELSDIRAGLAARDAGTLLRLADEHGLDYYVADSSASVDLPVLFEGSHHRVYDMRDTDP